MKFLIFLLILQALACTNLSRQRSVSSHWQKAPQGSNHYFHKAVLNSSEIKSSDEIVKYTAYIQTDNGLCSGVIINSDTVLTSAHCVLGRSYVDVFVGAKKSSSSLSQRSINITLHPMYSVEQISTGELKSTDQPKFLSFKVKTFNAYKQKYENLKDYKPLKKSELPVQFHKYFYDLALIHLDLPLSPIAPVTLMASVLPDFKTSIFTYGYGLGARKFTDYPSKNWKLGLGHSELVSYVHGENVSEPILFISRPLSHDQQTSCYGDSGGGAYIKEGVGEELQLFGLFSAVSNNCAGEEVILPLHPHWSWIVQQIREFSLQKKEGI